MTRHEGLGAIQIESDVQGVGVVDMAKGERGWQDSCKKQLVKREYRKIGKE